MSRDKKFALQAVSTSYIFCLQQSIWKSFFWNKTENILKLGFNLERTKFFEAHLSDTLSRCKQLQLCLMLNDITFLLHFITHMFICIRKQRSQEEHHETLYRITFTLFTKFWIILTRKRVCEQLQNCWEHEQASKHSFKFCEHTEQR